MFLAKKTELDVAYVKKQNAFTLIEILIAVLVLAIGLLGMAGLQTTGVRSNHSAYLRSQATVLANEIIDKMKANRDRDSDKFDTLSGYETGFGDEINNSPDCRSNACSESDMVLADLADWKNSLQTLPSGSGAISLEIDQETIIAEIKIRWDDDRGANGLTTFTTQTRL